jgi:hypothetical protein
MEQERARTKEEVRVALPEDIDPTVFLKSLAPARMGMAAIGVADHDP